MSTVEKYISTFKMHVKADKNLGFYFVEIAL